MESSNLTKNTIGKIKNFGSKKYTSASLTVTKYTNPITNFFKFFTGKYAGAVFSIITIFMFSMIFGSIMSEEKDQISTKNSIFITHTINTWLYILIILIVIHIIL